MDFVQVKRASAVVLAVVSLCISFGASAANDWADRGTWGSGDPIIRSTGSFSDRHPGAPSRSSGMSAGGGGSAVLTATRGYGGVFEVQKVHPISVANVAKMGRMAARASIGGVLGAAIIEALTQDGIGWDPNLGTWAYPSGEFYYDGYPSGITPSAYGFKVGTESACHYIAPSATVSLGQIQSNFRSCYNPSGTCRVATTYGYYPEGQFKRANCTGGTIYPVGRVGPVCTAPQVLLPDGTCGPMPPMIGGPSIPATDPEIETAIADHATANPQAAPDIAEQAASDGVPILGEPNTIGWGGPSSFPGESSTTTTTGPDGVTTTQRDIQHEVGYGPGNDDITISDRETVTTTHPDASVTTSTTTTGGTSTGTGGGNGSAPPPPPDVCKANPNASGCAPFGEFTDVTWETMDVVVDYAITPVSGQCPAPISLDVLGTVHALSWSPLCDFAEGVSFIVRAMAALSAGLWVLFMFRR